MLLLDRIDHRLNSHDFDALPSLCSIVLNCDLVQPALNPFTAKMKKNKKQAKTFYTISSVKWMQLKEKIRKKRKLLVFCVVNIVCICLSVLWFVFPFVFLPSIYFIFVVSIFFFIFLLFFFVFYSIYCTYFCTMQFDLFYSDMYEWFYILSFTFWARNNWTALIFAFFNRTILANGFCKRAYLQVAH